MAAVNSCIFIGNLGQDPEVRNTVSGGTLASFSIACNENYTNKKGEKVEKTEWIRVVAFNRLAEIAGEYLRKGSPVFVEGKFRTNKWVDKNGVTRYSSEIQAMSLQLLGSRDRFDPKTQGEVIDLSSAQDSLTQLENAGIAPKPKKPVGVDAAIDDFYSYEIPF